MGCDIHSYVEKRNENGKWENIEYEPFRHRTYNVFGFLADVRNYSNIPPISEPRGLPTDVSKEIKKQRKIWNSDGHSDSWLSIKELVDFNYDSLIEDQRVTIQTGPNTFNGGATCNPGEGKITTYRNFLGDSFFEDLQKLQDLGAERIVFWFDN